MTKLALGVLDAAQALGVSRALIYRLMDAGDLPYVKLGTRRLIASDALAALIKKRTVTKNENARRAGQASSSVQDHPARNQNELQK